MVSLSFKSACNAGCSPLSLRRATSTANFERCKYEETRIQWNYSQRVSPPELPPPSYHTKQVELQSATVRKRGQRRVVTVMCRDSEALKSPQQYAHPADTSSIKELLTFNQRTSFTLPRKQTTPRESVRCDDLARLGSALPDLALNPWPTSMTPRRSHWLLLKKKKTSCSQLLIMLKHVFHCLLFGVPRDKGRACDIITDISDIPRWNSANQGMHIHSIVSIKSKTVLFLAL